MDPIHAASKGHRPGLVAIFIGGCSVHSKICNQHLIVVKKGRESVEFQKQNIRCCFVSFDIAGE